MVRRASWVVSSTVGEERFLGLSVCVAAVCVTPQYNSGRFHDSVAIVIRVVILPQYRVMES